MSSPRYLDLRKIHSGDIFLSRPKKVGSAFIALLGNSRFSHAQLVVKPYLYEATLDQPSRDLFSKRKFLGFVKIPNHSIVGLVRGKNLTDCSFELITPKNPSEEELVRFMQMVRDDSGVVSVRDISHYAEFAVLRLRNSLNNSPKLQERLGSFCTAQHLKPYTQIDPLAKVSVWPLFVKITARVTGLIPDHVIPGMFCSQLVAEAYKRADVPLSEVSPEEITPGCLASFASGDDSRLIMVPLQELLFSPGEEYEMKSDSRSQNQAIDQHSVLAAVTVRAAESAVAEAMQIIDTSPTINSKDASGAGEK